GFILSGELSLNGPILLMSNSAFLWDVPQPKDSNGSSLWDGWTEDMFKVFETVEPRPELLVIGTGKSFTPLPPHLRKYLLSLGIQLETIDTKNACSTYNVMLEEGRSVAAALLPIAPTS
ncbi:NADH dehydrogenase 1 alpha subcomplex assembly factor 3, partial [Paraphysoderma sedebokerense]